MAENIKNKFRNLSKKKKQYNKYQKSTCVAYSFIIIFLIETRTVTFTLIEILKAVVEFPSHCFVYFVRLLYFLV